MTAIEIFITIALVAGILIAPFIIAAAVCALAVVVGLIIALLRFLFTIEVDDDGGVRECIGWPFFDCGKIKIHKKKQKKNETAKLFKSQLSASRMYGCIKK